MAETTVGASYEDQRAATRAARDGAISALAAVYPAARLDVLALFCDACGAMKESAAAACQWCITDPPPPVPPPPATDPQGWTPLVPGCAMPEIGQEVCVTIRLDDESTEKEIWRLSFCGQYSANGDEGKAGIIGFVIGGDWYFEADEFRHESDDWRQVIAWRPAPAPYRGGV